MRVNLAQIAAKHWLDYERKDLAALADVYAETVKACAEIAGLHSDSAKDDILERASATGR